MTRMTFTRQTATALRIPGLPQPVSPLIMLLREKKHPVSIIHPQSSSILAAQMFFSCMSPYEFHHEPSNTVLCRMPAMIQSWQKGTGPFIKLVAQGVRVIDVRAKI